MSEITKTEELAPKAEKKVTKQAAVAIEETVVAKNSVSEMGATIADAVKSSTNSVKETTTKVTSAISDATKSSVDAIKETYTTIESAFNDSRVSGNSRAKKILASVFDDKVNTTVNNIAGRIGEATSVCSTAMCAPMKMGANGMNTLYTKITA
jgi:hypothetical protein